MASNFEWSLICKALFHQSHMRGTEISVFEEGFWVYLCYFETDLIVRIQYFNSNFSCGIDIFVKL